MMPTLAYVANSNTVTVIDTSTNTIIDDIPAAEPGDYTVMVALTPDGKYAYVTNLYGTVSVIDTCSNAVIDVIRVGFNPIGIAITPDGKYAYVANSYFNFIAVIDTRINEVVDIILVGSEPLGVAITPNGNYAYVTIAKEDRVSVIDTNTKTVVYSIPVGDFPHGIAISPDGNYAYATNNGQTPTTTSVSVIDLNTNTVVDTIIVGFVPTTVAITPDSRFAYVTNAGDGTVSVIDTRTNSVINTIEVGSYDYGMALTPDGRYAYVANAGDDNISIIDTATNTVIDLLPVGNGPFSVTIKDIPPCSVPTDKICIETTRIFGMQNFEEQKQKTFNKPRYIEGNIQCKITEVKCKILNINRINEDLVDVKLQFRVFIDFTTKCCDKKGFKRVICFDKNIMLDAPEGTDISCQINDKSCECIKIGNISCDYKLCCTVKVSGIIKSKKLVQIEVPNLGYCN